MRAGFRATPRKSHNGIFVPRADKKRQLPNVFRIEPNLRYSLNFLLQRKSIVLSNSSDVRADWHEFCYYPSAHLVCSP